MKASFVVNDRAVFEKDKPLPMNLNISKEMSVGNSDNEVIVCLTLRINCDEQNNFHDNAPFGIEVAYAAQFTWDNEVEEKQKQTFLAINAPTLLLSYIRPIVTQLTACSPYPEYHVPFIDMNQLFGKETLNA